MLKEQLFGQLFLRKVRSMHRFAVISKAFSLALFLDLFFTFIHETVNSEVYIQVLENEFIPFLLEHGIKDTSYFMQDGAKPHTSNQTLEFLHQHFEGRIISDKYQQKFDCGLSWPAYSPDLNPCDFFLWGYIKSRVYASKPTTIQDLEASITHEMSNISADMLQKTFESFKKRLQAVGNANGMHIEGTPHLLRLNR